MTRALTPVALLAASALMGTMLLPGAAAAQDAAQIQAIQRQIQALQSQLRRLQQDAARRDAELRQAQEEAAAARAAAQQAQQRVAAAPPPAAVPAPPPEAFVKNGPCDGKYAAPDPNKPSPTFCLGNVSITLGGFVDVTGIYRSRNESAGTGTSFTNIPFPNNPNNHLNELRASAQQTRFTLLAQGKPYQDLNIAGYVELDLNSAGTTSNSNQTNSYTLRLRHAYAQVDDPPLGLHVLAGQTWSLLTPNTVGIVPRKEQIPLTIDTSYLPGFTYTRQPQIRVVKDFGSKYWLGVSLEAPQGLVNFNQPTAASSTATNFPGYPTGSRITYNNPGTGNLNSSANYSADIAPDIVIKAAADPGFGHYEVYGVGRWFQTRLSTPGTGSNKTAFGGGVGGAATVPLVQNYLDLTGNIIAGYGVGRYIASQLPDVTIKADGSPAPLPTLGGLVGLIGHPVKQADVYGYFGAETVGRKYFNSGGADYGYGAPGFNNSGCGTELASSSNCVGNTRLVWQATAGTWYRLFRGSFGTLLGGAQYSYTKRYAFGGVGGAPTTDENTVFVSLRYQPFQ